MSPVRSQPSAVSTAGGGLGVVPVAGEHVGPAHPDLARVAVEHVVAVVVDEAHLHAVEGLADRAAARLDADRGGDDGRRLGQPVALAHDQAERGPRAASATSSGSLAAPDSGLAHRGEGRRRGLRAAAAHATHIGGAPGTMVTPVAGHQLEGADRVEAGRQHEAGAGREGGVEGDAEAEDVEERQHAEHDVVGAEAVGPARHLVHVGAEGAVGEHGRPGRAGGAAGEAQHGDVVRVDVDDRHRRGRPPPTSSSISPADVDSTSVTPTACRSRSSSAGGLCGLSGTTMAPTPSTAR